MKSYLPIRQLTVLATGLALTMSVVAFRAQADQWDKKTVLTIDQPIQISKTYLEPGTYVFKLMDSQADRHIVQIFNKDQSHIIDTILAIPNYRLQPTGKSRFAFWETPAGNAKALRAWFYPGDNFGQEFAYPKHPRQLEVAMMSKQTLIKSSEAQNLETESNVIAKEETATEPQREAKVTASPEPEYQQSEVAQNEVAQATPKTETESYPAPSTATPSEQSAQSTPTSVDSNSSNTVAQRTTREELPKTASPYTSIGLFGVFMLGFYGLMRVKQTS